MKAKVNPVYVSRMEVKNHPIPSDLFGLVEKSFGALFFQRGAEVVERGADGLSFVAASEGKHSTLISNIIDS